MKLNSSLNKSPAVSIIVPVFNTKDYLTRCLDSAVNQTLKNIEIIVVDDGSTDGSGEICDTYAKKDCRIKVFHIENTGGLKAMNLGIDNAHGEYLAFLDSDDAIDLDYCEKLYKKATEEDADICRGECRRIHWNSQTTYTSINKEIRDKKSKLFNMYYWFNALYRRSLLNNNKIRFREDSVYFSQDVLFQNQAVIKCNRLALCDDAYYTYYRRQGSADSFSTFNQEKMKCAINTYTKVTDNVTEGKSISDKSGILHVYFHSIRNLLGLLGRLKNLNMWGPCLDSVDSIFKKCPYKSELKKLLIDNIHLAFLNKDNITLLQNEGIKVPGIIKNIVYRYKTRRRFIRIIVKLLVNKQRYKKFKRDPGRFFGDSKSRVIKYLGRLYR